MANRKVIGVAIENGNATYEMAMGILSNKLDAENLDKLNKIKNPEVIMEIAKVALVANPDDIFVYTGSEADKQTLKQIALETGEETQLANPNHSYHMDLPEEQGRLVKQAYSLADEDEEVSSLANRMSREEGAKKIKEAMSNILVGKKLLVGFFSRGPLGCPEASDPALVLAQSSYVLHSCDILDRNAFEVFDKEVKQAGFFQTHIQAQGDNTPEDLKKALVLSDSRNLKTYTFFNTYAGNSMRLKKGGHSLTIARNTEKFFGEKLAEHMFVTGIPIVDKNGKEDIVFISGASPSGCGKTTTAMAGKIFVSDDLAHKWIVDGKVRVINPEKGIFAIVENVSWSDDPKVMKVLRSDSNEVIWSNVLISPELVPYWQGNGEEIPNEGINFQGEWHPGKLDADGNLIPISHPNSRATFDAKALDIYSEIIENPEGVHDEVVTYSGRDADTNVPVWVAKSPEEGVVIGAAIVSKATATEVDSSGVKLAPLANRPFLLGSLGRHIEHQFAFATNPKIKDKQTYAGLNYFLTDEARGGTSKALLGEKRDVKVWLGWLARQKRGLVDTIEAPIGFIPTYKDLKRLFSEIIGKEYSKTLYNKQFSLYVDKLVARIDYVTGKYEKDKSPTPIPQKLFDILDSQRAELLELKEKFGSIVTPDQLLSLQQENSSEEKPLEEVIIP